MEVVFYVGMIIFGFYCLVTEPIEKVEKDFGISNVEFLDLTLRDDSHHASWICDRWRADQQDRIPG